MIWKIMLLAGLLQFTTSAFAIDAGDDFDDNSVDVTKWGTDTVFGRGTLAETGEHLEYTVSAGTSFDEVDRPWILTQFPTTNDWDVILNVVNAGNLGKKQIISFGFYIRNWTDPFDNISAELYASTYSGVPASHGFYSSLYADNKFVNNTDTFDLQTTTGAVRVAFSSTTKVFTIYYDADPSDGYQWTVYATYGTTGSGGFSDNANWNMTDNDRFELVLYGYGTKAAVAPGTTYGDDLATTEGVAYQIPPTTLTGSFAGVKQKCKTTCSLKGKLVMQNGTTSPALDTRVRVFVSTDQTYNDGIDTLLSSLQTGFVKPGKSKKLKVTGTSGSSRSGMYLLAVDDSGAVLNTFLIP